MILVACARWPSSLLAAASGGPAGQPAGRTHTLLRCQIRTCCAHPRRTALDQLLQDMLKNARTVLAATLLTGDDRYLQPYTVASSNFHWLRQTYWRLPRDQTDFAQLCGRSRASCPSWTRKGTDLRRQNNDDAWRFVYIPPT